MPTLATAVHGPPHLQRTPPLPLRFGKTNAVQHLKREAAFVTLDLLFDFLRPSMMPSDYDWQMALSCDRLALHVATRQLEEWAAGDATGFHCVVLSSHLSSGCRRSRSPATK